MNIRKALLSAAGIAVLALVISLAAPRAVHAITATLVQVQNTPLPVLPTQTTAVIAAVSQSVVVGTPVVFGPYDVSEYSTIRFFGSANAVSAAFQLTAVDSQLHEYVLDQPATTDTVPTVTGAYQTPGTSLKIYVTPGALGINGNKNGTGTVNFVIYGR